VEDVRPAPATPPTDNAGREPAMPVAEFEVSTGRRIWLLVVGSTILVLCLALGFAASQQPWWQRFSFPSLMGMGFLTFVGLPSGAILLYKALTLPRLRAVVGLEGISLSEGDTTQSCLWTEIKSVREVRPLGYDKEYLKALARGETRMHVIECFDGRKLTFRNFISGLGRLAEQIHQATLPLMFPPVQEALAAGASIRFGPITVSARDISGKSGHALPWEDFVTFKVAEGSLRIRQTRSRHDWLAVPIGDVPNPHVLFALAKDICRK
jgi:hypothetical protein